jgi:hypothetical protein
MANMKPLHALYLLTAIALVLSACMPNNPTTDAAFDTPTPVLQTATPLSSATMPPMPTATLLLAPTATLTPPATLEPEQAKETIQKLLQEPSDCAAPCFWGITLGKTTFGEAKNIFTRFGLQMEHTNTQGTRKFYEIILKLDSDLSVSPLLTIQNDVVTNIDINISPETQKAEVQREWQAYSPETLIKRYGAPSKVNFWVGRGPKPSYEMGMYFDTVDLLIIYVSYDLGPNLDLQACPISRQIDHIRILLGQGPEYRDSEWVPLEEATSLTMEGFSKLMTGDPNKACINFKLEIFP